MRSLWILCFVFILGSSLNAQVIETQTVKTNANTYDEVKLLYRNEATFGGVIHSNGFGLNYRRGWHVTAARKRLFEIEGVNFKHSKEIKVVNPYFDHPKGYYYGKLNYLFLLRSGFGYQNVIFTKPERNGVEIRYVTSIGLSLGFAKPVYLEILKDSPIPGGDAIVVEEKYNPDVHFIDDIYGRGPFLKGFSEMTLHPGGYARFGLSFEYGPMESNVKVLEVGACLDIFPRAVPLMATQRNQQALLSLYLHFSFGKKWF
jgi:hypothetical protein